MLGGHSTLNTAVLGEGMSKYQIPPTSATIAADGPNERRSEARASLDQGIESSIGYQVPTAVGTNSVRTDVYMDDPIVRRTLQYKPACEHGLAC
jgi:hypothetical protein